MSTERSIARYRRWYRKLIGLYPGSFYERFGDSMEQTFDDLCHDRASAGDGLFGCVLWVFAETSAAIAKENIRSTTMTNKAIFRIAVVTLSILLLPLVAMQFTDEVAWDLSDFVVAGGLLFAAGLSYELVASKGSMVTYRAAVGVAVGAALLLVWMNLAVGLIGNENNPANLMYCGVLLVGLIGISLARFQPREMARALVATAITQALVPIIAMIVWRPQITSGLVGVFLLNSFFVALWIVSALLFRQTADTLAKMPGDGRRSGAS